MMKMYSALAMFLAALLAVSVPAAGEPVMKPKMNEYEIGW